MSNCFGFENLGVGLGLRTVHYSTILSERPSIDWFEIISENFMETAGRPLYILDQIREHYPIVMHGVSMSVGSTDPLDMEYLKRLKALRDRVGAPWLSDHLCWTGVHHRNSHDLLPLPYTEEVLAHVAERVRTVQDVLEAPLVLENPSTYLEFAGSTMTEWDFLRALCEQANCGLLLDVNNVYVSAQNHGYDPAAYLDGMPWDRIAQLHVSGHTDNGACIIDTHICPVIDPVWEIFRQAYERCGGASMLLEWDAEIPGFEEAHREALKARNYATIPSRATPPPTTRGSAETPSLERRS